MDQSSGIVQGGVPQFLYRYYGLPPGSVMRGTRINGSMSPIRRFFCLFITFDLLLTCLLWFISLVIEGNFDMHKALDQILHYDIRTSMFDIILASGSRFVLLLLFYGFLQIQHWSVVAGTGRGGYPQYFHYVDLTTALTGLLLVGKVYVLDWGDATSQIFKVVLIISSFTLSWAEAWLLDIKVVPQEKFAQEYLAAQTAASSLFDERTPLIQNFLQSQQRLDLVSESMGSFYSPMESSEDSGDEQENRSIGRRSRRSRKSLPPANNYLERGEEFLLTSWQVLNSDDWDFEKTTQEGDTIRSRKLNSGRKVFQLQGSLEIETSALVNVLFNEVESFPKWNPTIKESRILQVVNSTTDVSYQISKDFGPVSSREYVTLRHMGNVAGWTIIANGSIVWPRLPSSKSTVRGDIGPSCWAVRHVSDKITEVRWLLDLKVNGWVPLITVESRLAAAMEDTMTNLRKHCSSLSPKPEVSSSD